MKILLVNNNTKHLTKLNFGLAGHDVEIIDYAPGVELNAANKDLVILSGGGGEGREATDRHQNGDLWYKDEIEFILRSEVPVLGICMGFELICHAYGSAVELLSKEMEGLSEIKLLSGQKIEQYESHDWGILSLKSNELEVRADSKSGIEIVKHKIKPIIGTQFHPELGGTLGLRQFISSVA